MGSFIEKVRVIYEKNQLLCRTLNRSQKFYYFGIGFCLLTAFWYLTPFTKIFLSVFIVSGFLLTCGVVSDILFVYKKVWNTNIGKGLILIIYAAATNFAYALSSQVVNEIVQFESSKLSYSINLVAVMLLPLFVLILTYVLFAIIFIFGQFYMLIVAHVEEFKNNECLKYIIPDNIESYPFKTFIIRFIVFPLVFGFYWSIAGHAIPTYGSFVESTAKAFIYHFEARKYSRCELLSEQKAIEINDTELVVVEKIKDSFSFTPKSCVPRLKSNK